MSCIGTLSIVDVGDFEAEAVLDKNARSMAQRVADETKYELGRVMNRVETIYDTYEMSGYESSSIDNVEYVNDIAELTEILNDQIKKKKYQQRVSIFIVGFDEVCGQKLNLLQQVNEFFTVNSKRFNDEDLLPATPEFDLDDVGAKVEESLSTAASLTQKIAGINKEMVDYATNWALSKAGNKGRKKLEKQLVQARDEAASMGEKLLEVQRELDIKDEKMQQVLKSLEAKNMESQKYKTVADVAKRNIEDVEKYKDEIKKRDEKISELTSLVNSTELDLAQVTHVKEQSDIRQSAVTQENSLKVEELQKQVAMKSLLLEEAKRDLEHVHNMQILQLSDAHKIEMADMQEAHAREIQKLLDNVADLNQQLNEQDIAANQVEDSSERIEDYESEVTTLISGQSSRQVTPEDGRSSRDLSRRSHVTSVESAATHLSSAHQKSESGKSATERIRSSRHPSMKSAPDKDISVRREYTDVCIQDEGGDPDAAHVLRTRLPPLEETELDGTYDLDDDEAWGSVPNQDVRARFSQYRRLSKLRYNHLEAQLKGTLEKTQKKIDSLKTQFGEHKFKWEKEREILVEQLEKMVKMQEDAETDTDTVMERLESFIAQQERLDLEEERSDENVAGTEYSHKVPEDESEIIEEIPVDGQISVELSDENAISLVLDVADGDIEMVTSVSETPAIRPFLESAVTESTELHAETSKLDVTVPAFEDKMEHGMEDDLEAKVEEHIERIKGEQTEGNMEEGIEDNVEEQMEGKVEEQMENNVEEEIEVNVEEQMEGGEEIKENMEELMAGNEGSKLEGKIESNMEGDLHGKMDADAMPFMEGDPVEGATEVAVQPGDDHHETRPSQAGAKQTMAGMEPGFSMVGGGEGDPAIERLIEPQNRTDDAKVRERARSHTVKSAPSNISSFRISQDFTTHAPTELSSRSSNTISSSNAEGARINSAKSRSSIRSSYKSQLEEIRSAISERRERTPVISIPPPSSGEDVLIDLDLNDDADDEDGLVREESGLMFDIGTSPPPPLALRRSGHSEKRSTSTGFKTKEREVLLSEEFIKAYKEVVMFKEAIGQTLLDKDMMTPSQVVSDLEVVLLDESTDIVSQFQNMTENIHYVLNEILSVMDSVLYNDRDPNVSSLNMMNVSRDQTRILLTQGKSDSGRGLTETRGTLHSGGSHKSNKTSASDDQESALVDLRTKYHHLQQLFEDETTKHERMRKENDEIVMTLHMTLNDLRTELSALRESIQKQSEQPLESAVMFTRLDSERNSIMMKRAVLQRRLDAQRYKDAVSHMSEYVSLPAQRLTHLVRKYLHHCRMKNIEACVQQKLQLDDDLLETWEKMELLQKHRAQRWADEMDSMSYNRLRLANVLMETLADVEHESGIFLIKPLFSYRNGSKHHPGPLKLSRSYHIPAATATPTRAPAPTPATNARSIAQKLKMNQAYGMRSKSAGLTWETYAKSGDNASLTDAQKSSLTRYDTLLSRRYSLPPLEPISLEGAGLVSDSSIAGSAFWNVEDSHTFSRSTRMKYDTPRLLELDVNRTLIGQNNVTSDVKLETFGSTNQNNARSYVTVSRPMAALHGSRFSKLRASDGTSLVAVSPIQPTPLPPIDSSASDVAISNLSPSVDVPYPPKTPPGSSVCITPPVVIAIK